MQTIDEIDREIAAKQTHCYTCGGAFGAVKYECPTCREWQCSEECLREHIEWMDNI